MMEPSKKMESLLDKFLTIIDTLKSARGIIMSYKDNVPNFLNAFFDDINSSVCLIDVETNKLKDISKKCIEHYELLKKTQKEMRDEINNNQRLIREKYIEKFNLMNAKLDVDDTIIG